MNGSTLRVARLLAGMACTAMAGTPVLAAGLPPAPATSPVWSPATDTVHDRWHGGGRWHGRHDDDGIDGGDLIAGILLLGGIAAIVSASSKSDQQRRAASEQAPYQPAQPPASYAAPQDGRDGQVPGNDDTRALDDAADACVEAVSDHGKVDHVYRVDPSTGGYRVSGDFLGGETFACSVGNGRVGDVYFGNAPRARTGDVGAGEGMGIPEPQQRSDAPPAPSPDDGRYDAAASPDFAASPPI